MPLFGTRILAGSWQCWQGDETNGSSFPIRVHCQGKSKTLCPQSRPRAQAVSDATALARGFREVCDPRAPVQAHPVLHHSASHQGKPLTVISQSFWEKQKEMEQRTWEEGEGVCCLLPSCRPEGLGQLKSLLGSPEGLVNPEGHRFLSEC